MTVYSLKYRTPNVTSLPTLHFAHQFKTATTLLSKDKVIANLCEKLCCTECVANDIYNKFPSLQLADAIKNDSLKILQDQVSLQSIVENASLVTMDTSKNE